jgi:hypothetical protein
MIGLVEPEMAAFFISGSTKPPIFSFNEWVISTEGRNLLMLKTALEEFYLSLLGACPATSAG